MPEIVRNEPKPKARPGNSADRDALAQVERWMAMIREISREQQANNCGR